MNTSPALNHRRFQLARWVQISLWAFSLSAMLISFCVNASTTLPAGAVNTVVGNHMTSGVTSAALPFTLPSQLRAQYTGVGKYGKLPLSGNGVITWSTTTQNGVQQYQASLEIGALFYKTAMSSQGIVNTAGIHPQRTEEKTTGKSGTIITIDHRAKSASLAGKENAIPYDAAGQDLLTVIAQLGTYVQTQANWRTAGEQKTFNVYRPGGLKPWRFQSQGMQNVTFNGVRISTVHVMQIARDGETDQEEQHHFWLDPTRHGFPIKLRKVKSGGDYVELTLKDWQEQ